MAEKKAGLASISEGRSDIHRIDPRLLNVKPNWNGRDFTDPDNIAHVEELSLSIAEIGVKDPLTVVWENGKAWLVDGECRHRASLLAIERGAPLKTIPVRSEERGSNDADLLFSQIIRNKKQPFKQMELARICKRLCDMGWQQQDIARKSGVTSARISQLLNLLTLPEPIKQMVTNGEVSASMAVNTVAVHNPQKAVRVLQDAVAVAKEAGKTKAMPKHVIVENGRVFARDVDGQIREVSEDATVPAAKGVKKPRNLSIEKTVHEAFEYALVDEEQINDQGEAVVVVTFPVEWFEKMRDALKL